MFIKRFREELEGRGRRGKKKWKFFDKKLNIHRGEKKSTRDVSQLCATGKSKRIIILNYRRYIIMSILYRAFEIARFIILQNKVLDLYRVMAEKGRRNGRARNLEPAETRDTWPTRIRDTRRTEIYRMKPVSFYRPSI